MSVLTAMERKLRATLFRPAPHIKGSAWCDEFRVLAKIEGAEEGRWRTDRAPYQREILDVMVDPDIQEVVWIKCAQIGATVCMTNVCLYYMHQEPSQIMMVQPSEDLATKWSTTRLAPAIEATPVVRGMILEHADGGARHANNTQTFKGFVGGYITIAWSSSDAKMRSLPIRVILFDEIDLYVASKEGDAIKRGEQRTATFGDRRKIIKASTPTLKGHSKIEKRYLFSDQRRYYVHCPDCKHQQTLIFDNLRYDKPTEGTTTTEQIEAAAASVRYACVDCGSLWEESCKAELLAGGKWIATHPGRPIAGFHINALYSPWTTWAELIKEWLEAQGDPELMQAFTNLKLGESWEDRDDSAKGDLLTRREDWGEAGTIPMPVGMITAWSDVQKDRIETQVMGHGGATGDEWFVLEERTFTGNTEGEKNHQGDVQLGEVWKELDAFRKMPRTHACGLPIRFSAFLVDCNYNGEEVLSWTKPRQGQKVAATRGKGKKPPKTPLVSRRPQRNNAYSASEWHINTDAGKDIVYNRLKIQQPGQKFVHLPAWVDEEFVRQLMSETKVRKKSGDDYRLVYKKRYDRNEVLDQFVGNLVASQPHICGLSREQIARRVVAFARHAAERSPPDTSEEAVGAPALETEVEVPVEPPKKRVVARSRGASFANRWRSE